MSAKKGFKAYDDLLSGLEDDPEEALTPSTTEPNATSGGEDQTEGSSAQRGKRADPDYVQVNANIPKDLRATLAYYLKEERKPLSDLIEELLEEYVEEQGGYLVPKKRQRRK